MLKLRGKKMFKNAPLMITRDMRWTILELVIIILAIFLTGCDGWHYEHTTFDPNEQVFTHTEASGHSFIMDSNFDNLKVEVEKDKRTITIGSVDKSPDPNTVKAVVEGVVEGVGNAIKGGL